jgi:putative flippase GtrA
MKSIIRKVLTGEFIKFVIVGGISALIEYSLYFLFKNYLDYLVANILAFAFTNIFTFILSRRYVFPSSNNNRTQEATLFVVCLAGALMVNQIVLWVLVEFAHTEDKYAKAIAIAVTVIWNFFTRKHIVFKNREQVAAETTSTEDYRSKRF